LVINAQPWSILLLLGLGAMFVVVYRSYAQFVQQHRSLTELYELTQAISEAARENALPDALLGRVRELLQAESATMWLPHRAASAVLLTDGLTIKPARHGGHSGTPATVGRLGWPHRGGRPRLGNEELRAELRDSASRTRSWYRYAPAPR